MEKETVSEVKIRIFHRVGSEPDLFLNLKGYNQDHRPVANETVV